MEYLDLYDKDKNLTGKKIIRGKGKPEIPEGNYINIVLIFIENSNKEFLIQKTSKEKGSEYATTGGHVQSGDTSNETVIKEVKEELGIDISKSNFKLIDTFIFKDSVLFDVYYLKENIDINKLKLQVEEVESISWMSIEEINNLIENNEFRKSNEEAFKKLVKTR